ncbi:MAG: HAD family hydrolase [Catenulispora sp.]|nr:HAD family hydrolase [Catenulispora sp.]
MQTPGKSRTIEAVVFDVGETLVDETIEYHNWADWLGVPRHTFSAVFGAVIAAGRSHLEAFRYFRPDFDLELERERRTLAGRPEGYGERDLYPDARRTLAALKDAGYLVLIAANQTAASHRVLESLELPVHLVTTSAMWGNLEKPDPAFFAKVVEVCDEVSRREERGPLGGPASVLYVGDRLDNDMRPAWDAGLRTAFIRRGAWGMVFGEHPDLVAKTDFYLTSLDQLPGMLGEEE